MQHREAEASRHDKSCCKGIWCQAGCASSVAGAETTCGPSRLSASPEAWKLSHHVVLVVLRLQKNTGYYHTGLICQLCQVAGTQAVPWQGKGEVRCAVPTWKI